MVIAAKPCFLQKVAQTFSSAKPFRAAKRPLLEILNLEILK